MSDYSTPKGMRDFSGATMLLRQKMVSTIEGVYAAWGYQPLSTPAMESVSTLNAKAGAEIAGQLFRIEDSELALRFDLTVPLARFAANSSMPKPYKRYAIAPVWRREEPQKGRLREFLQADADIIGSPSMRAEAELLAMASDALARLGFADFTILLSNRKILSAVIQKLKIQDETGAFRALDKLDKIGPEGVRAELAKAGLDEGQCDALLKVISRKSGETNERILKSLAAYSEEGASELGQILEFLKPYALLGGKVKIEPSLVRGLGYYTGPIFEIKASDTIGSVAGGGRYDNLLSIYGQSDSAVGISLGIERLIALQEGKSEKGAKARVSGTDILLVAIDESCYAKTVELAKQLRALSLSAETDLNGRNMRKQLDYANALGIPFALIVGKKEIASEKYILKDLQSGEQKELSVEQAVKQVLKSKEKE